MVGSQAIAGTETVRKREYKVSLSRRERPGTTPAGRLYEPPYNASQAMTTTGTTNWFDETLLSSLALESAHP